jgi:hypothetical protein
MITDTALLLKELQALDFTDKGEAFVEARFLTPLLTGLGYSGHARRARRKRKMQLSPATGSFLAGA